jgi:hypothetical protein
MTVASNADSGSHAESASALLVALVFVVVSGVVVLFTRRFASALSSSLSSLPTHVTGNDWLLAHQHPSIAAPHRPHPFGLLLRLP